MKSEKNVKTDRESQKNKVTPWNLLPGPRNSSNEELKFFLSSLSSF